MNKRNNPSLISFVANKKIYYNITMKSQKVIIIVLILLISYLGLLWPQLSQAQTSIDPSFNPNRIISNNQLLDYKAMNLNDIENFLISKGSFLTNYTAIDSNGQRSSAARIIYNATHNNYDCDGVTLSASPSKAEKIAKCKHITTVNPKLILVLLQKEQSLIEDTNPPQRHLDWATGYGCPDSWICNPYYKGFGKQVNSAALQFLSYMKNPNYYNYQAGKPYTIYNTINPYLNSNKRSMTVIPENRATAALYDYTPHVFNGNYNFYKLWNRYFPSISRTYPDGSVIKAKNDPRVWLIEGGHKRLFANWSAFISRFSPKQIVQVTKADLNKYPTGNIIKFANYSVVQTPNKKIYLLVDKQKRPFVSEAVFKKIGFNPGEIEVATVADLQSYKTGSSITATSTYVTGALLQDQKTHKIYYVQNGTRALVDKILLPLKFPYQRIIKVSSKKLEAYATTSPILLNEGTLVKTTSFPTVYLISGGKKRPFASEAVFKKLGYNYANVVAVSSQFLYNYNMGKPIK